MALQNRVTPFGEIVATPARGTMFGNRGGCFHDDNQHLTKRRWASRAWICCLLEFKGRHIEKLMAPGHYTELFFLDEATAFAAGHRPCFECRRADAVRFRQAWFEGNGVRLGLDTVPLASDMDRVVHEERLAVVGREGLVRSDMTALPEGALVVFDDAQDDAWLITGGEARRWSFEGYTERRPLAGSATVLTPASIVAAFECGYRPAVHESAHR